MNWKGWELRGSMQICWPAGRQHILMHTHKHTSIAHQTIPVDRWKDMRSKSGMVWFHNMAPVYCRGVTRVSMHMQMTIPWCSEAPNRQNYSYCYFHSWIYSAPQQLVNKLFNWRTKNIVIIEWFFFFLIFRANSSSFSNGKISCFS